MSEAPPKNGGAATKAGSSNWEIETSCSPPSPQAIAQPDFTELSVIDQPWAARMLARELAACDSPDSAATDWLISRGVDPGIISGEFWPGPVKVANVVPCNDGGFRFGIDADRDSVKAFVLGCPLSRAPIEGLADLVAWQPCNSCVFWMRWGVHRFFPEKELHLAAVSERPFRHFANPFRWLLADGEGCVDCSWTGALR
jgi:hypothetical protein